MTHKNPEVNKKVLAGVAIGAALSLWALSGFLARRAFSFAGKRVLITGGSRGLGFVLAQELGRQGCRVAICARDAEELNRAQEQLQHQGIEVFKAVCDVAKRDQVQAMVTRVTRHFGGIDLLINNAGVIQFGPLASARIEYFEDAMDVIFWGTLHSTLAVLPQMRARGEGWIVNITSIGGKVNVPHLLPYSAAKFATVGLSNGLHIELAKEGIHVTTVVPGLMRTGSHLFADFMGDHKKEYTLFALGAGLPFISIDAQAAARQILDAVRSNASQVVISGPAILLERLQALFPQAMLALMAIGNQYLPAGSPESAFLQRGIAIESQLPEQQRETLRRATTLAQGPVQTYQFHEPAAQR